MNFAQMGEQYIVNLRRIRALARPQYTQQQSDAELLGQIQSNAVQSFSLMCENNRLLDGLLKSCPPEELTDEQIQQLFDFAGKLFNFSKSEDAGIAYKTHSLLLAAARARGDDKMIIRELYYTGTCLFYADELEVPDCESPTDRRMRTYFQEGATYMARYEEFDEKTRDYIIRCLGNCKMRVQRRTLEECRKYYEIWDKAVAIMTSDYYRTLNPNLPWDNYYYTMCMDQLTVQEYIRNTSDPAPDIVQRVLEAATFCYERKYRYSSQDARLRNWRVGHFYHAARFHAGLETARELMEYLLDVVETSPADDYSSEGINIHLFLPGYLHVYWKYLSPEDAQELMPRREAALAQANDYIGSIRTYDQPYIINRSLHMLVVSQAQNVTGSVRALFQYFLTGHSPTYIHSLMVAELTRRIVRRMLEVNPAALRGTLGFEDEAALRANAEFIEQRAYKCGLYHDMGKSMVLMYISNNARRLLDEEFACIQSHPLYGYTLLCTLGREKDLAQAALYHHVFYDGSGGYPRDRGVCPPSMKPIVDVISVADSLDAATDGVGRCYTAAKPYESLINEVQTQQGTRYSPAVAALFDDKGFYAELKEALYRERNKIYIQVYKGEKK